MRRAASRTVQIAGSDNRHRAEPNQFLQEPPIGFSAVQLLPGAGMETDRGRSGIDGSSGSFAPGEFIVVPSAPDLDGNRKAGFSHGLNKAADESRIPAECRTGAASCNLGNRASGVQIENPGTVFCRNHRGFLQ